MNLLELAKENHAEVYETEERIKVPMLNGKYEMLPVYKINIKNLYYNDKNARIASWVSKFKQDYDISDFDLSNHETYNSIIEDFIVKSNEVALKKTQKDIAAVGQNVAGVVLKDGRVIDGNRRFTCLRRIQKATGVPQMFSACIVQYDVEADAKAIKEMELMLQIGTEKPLDYDPIERLQDIFTTVIENKLLSESEYAERCKLSMPAMKKELQKCQILVDFLEFIGAPKEFYRARELKFDGPLNEIMGIISKKTEAERAQLLQIAFSNFIVQPDGDMTRFIRNIKKIAGNEAKLNDFIEEENQYVEQVIDTIGENGDTTTAIQKLRSDKQLANTLSKVCERYKILAGKQNALDGILDDAETALNLLEDIDSDLFVKLTDEQIEMLAERLNAIAEKARTLGNQIDAIKS